MVLDGSQESFSEVTFKLVPKGRGASHVKRQEEPSWQVDQQLQKVGKSAYICEEQRDHLHCSGILIEWENDMKRG